MALLLSGPALLRAQDAAVEERLNKLTGRLDDLSEANNSQKKKIDELEKQVRELQEQQNKPNISYASQEDVKQLTAKLKEIDDKRVQDNEKIVKQISKLGQTLDPKPGNTRKTTGADTTSTTSTSSTATPTVPDKVYKYTVQSGDTLEGIVRAYKKENIKVTVSGILGANPGLKAENLVVGKEINIPPAQ